MNLKALLCTAIVSWVQPVLGQDPYVLSIDDVLAGPGSELVVPVLLDSVGGDDIQAWSFGVCHDPEFFTGATAEPGATTIAVVVSFDYVIEYDDGVAMFAVISYPGLVSLPPGTGYELLEITYQLSPDADGSTELSFCSTLGTPPVSVEVVVGGFPLYPDQVSGTVSTGAAAVFVRGDANADGNVDIGDAVFALSALLLPGSPTSVCEDSLDVNDDEIHDVADVVFGLSALFTAGAPEIPQPFPGCGADPDGETLLCEDYPPCP